MGKRVKYATRAFAAGVAMIALGHSQAWAQEASPTDKTQEGPADEIVVTGTLIRGVAPGGSQTIAVDREQIARVGAVNTSDLLASVPQAGNFLSYVGVKGSSNFSLTVNRPTLRYLGNTSSSTNSTLLLVDGHRLPGMGVLQNTPDLDAIAPGAIERVEIVTDGGSSTYGSDAVGGVINFITRKGFDGVETRGSYGFADNYRVVNGSILAGKAWDWGSIYVSYDYAHHDDIKGSDRDFSRNLDWINTQALGTPVGADNQCASPNIQIGGATYAYPGLAQGIGNRCDNQKLTSYYPEETKHTVFASAVIEDGGPVTFSLKGFYVNRVNRSDGGPFTGSFAVPATSPFYVPIPGRTGAETVLLNFSPALGNSSSQVTRMESWGITPSIKADLGGTWQLNAQANYGKGKANFRGNLLNPAPITAAVTAGTFNPFNLTAASNAATLATATNWFNYGRGEDELLTARLVADGALVHLPAGDLRVALGAEYMYEKYAGNNSRGLTQAGINALTNAKATRRVQSVFGEVNVPILGEDVGIFHSLTLTASGRYDDYSDFGGTFNPKLGLTFEPVEWLRLRGNWGKAFQAPGLADIALAAANNLNVIPLSVRNFADPTVPAGTTNNNTLVVLGGVISPLQPQKAKTWSAGFDIKPSAIPELAVGATYYNVDFKGQIAIPPIFTPAIFYRQFPNNYVLYTAGNAAMQTYLNQLTALASNPQALAALPNGINSVYAVIDDRSQNLAAIKTSGIDFYGRYRIETGFGGIFANVSGTYILSFKNQANPNAPLLDIVNKDLTRFRVSTQLGADIGGLRVQGTWDHASGFATTPTAANLQQARIGAFDVFNLFLRYEVPDGSSLLKDLAFTVNVDNVFDKAPPLYRGTYSGGGNTSVGFANGFTLGRLVRVGVSKKF
ncbi:MAG: TonB-dependent receptor [Alphaproteobacteria bacterium]|nr:MAG: TonB-dependent receptor [Alphaproteobacteria bacterium]